MTGVNQEQLPFLYFPSSIKHILLDIEGTTSSIKFVYEILFPYVHAELRQFLSANWGDAKVKHAIETIATDIGYSSAVDWFGRSPDSAAPLCHLIQLEQAIAVDEITRLMDNDVKATGLKELQGLIWDIGYRKGSLCSHVYPDVPIALEVWTRAGLDVQIYSSGSIAAQKVFFANTERGSMSKFLSGYYDTTSGAKRESSSYAKIAADSGVLAKEFLFLSDIPEELEAALAAGMHVALVVRPGNPISTSCLRSVDSFAQIQFRDL